MKMRQKGIATATIAIVVIVVIAVVGVGAFLVLRTPTGPGGISLPGGFSQTAQTTVDGYTITTYTGSGTVAGATSAFKTAFQAAGWTFKGEGSFAGYTGVMFEKGNEVAGFYAVEAGGRVTVIVGVGPKPAEEDEEETEENEDVTPGEGIAAATSLDYKVEYTYMGQAFRYRYRARNINTANMDMRVDWTADGDAFSYILSGSQRKVWFYSAGEWMDASEIPGFDFDTYWDMYYTGYETYTGYLAGWTAGEWSGTYGGVTYRIYDIQVNPSLPDWVFQPG